MTISRRPLRLTLAALVSLTLSIAPTRAADLYWDADLTAAGNNVSGNGLGGPGTWDTVSTSFWNPLSPGSNAVWSDTSQVVFTGTAGEVLIPSAATSAARIERVVSGVTFNSNDIVLSGGTADALGGITFDTVVEGVIVDSVVGELIAAPGVVGTIAARIAGTSGFNVSGGGTIRLAPALNVNVTSGPINVSGGSTLELSRSGDVGMTGVGSGLITLNGGTLRNTSTTTTFLSTGRSLHMGALGGTVEPQGTGLYSGTISGGTLTKVGAGELRLAGGAAQVNSHEKTVVGGGMLSLGTGSTLGSDRNLGAVPSGFMADNLTLEDGTILRLLGTDGGVNDTIVLHQNRGITLNGAVTFNHLTAAAVINGGISGPGSITKVGTFMLTLGGAGTYTGGTLIDAGSLRITNTTGSATGSGPVFLSIGTLDGTGTISGVVSASPSTRISAGLGGGNSALTLGALLLEGSNVIDTLVGGLGSDKLVVTQAGGFDFSSGAVLNVGGAAGTGSPAGQTFTLIDYNNFYSGDLNTGLTINNSTGYDAVVFDNVANSSIDVTLGTVLQDKEWSNGAGGNWSDVDDGNWTSPGRPNGPSTSARFLSAATTPVTVTISDLSKTVGQLVFNNTNKYTIAATSTSQRLLFNTYEGKASLKVEQGNHDILARITFNAETDIDVAETSIIRLEGLNTSNNGINIVGGGTVVITQNWTGNGAMKIVDGTLKFETGNAGISNFGQLEIGEDGTFDMTSIPDGFGYLTGEGDIINGGDVRLAGNNTSPAVWNGNYTGTSATRLFRKSGTGTQVLGGHSNFLTSEINGGLLLVNNSTEFGLGTEGVATVASTATLGGNGILGNRVTVNSGGTIAPGAEGNNSIGTLTIDGAVPTEAALTLATGGGLSFDLGTGMASDTIALSNAAPGDVVFNSNVINFTDVTSGGLAAGDYTLFSSDAANAYAGNFDIDTENLITAGLVIGTGLSAYESAVLKLVGNSIVLSLNSSTNILEGDFNGDGFVNLADYTVWRDNLGATEGDLLSGNGTGGVIDADDYNLWKGNFGAPNAGSLSTGGSAAVPEPSSVVTLLAGVAATVLCIRKRRANS